MLQRHERKEMTCTYSQKRDHIQVSCHIAALKEHSLYIKKKSNPTHFIESTHIHPFRF